MSQEMFKTISENAIPSEEEIIGIQEKKKEYLKGIETKTQKFKEYFKN